MAATVYLSAAAIDQLTTAQRALDEHITSSATGYCLRCQLIGPCLTNEQAAAAFTRYGRLPRRTPGATRPQLINARRITAGPDPAARPHPEVPTVTLPDIAAALRDLHVSIGQQQDLTKVVIQDAENARAEFRALTTGATNPLVNRALGNYAQGIVKLRDGSWLLAEAGGILAEYARAIGIDMPPRQPPEGKRKIEPIHDEQSDIGPRQPGTQRLPQADEPASRDPSAG